MPYQVTLLKRAEQDLHAAADWIAEHSPAAANRWFNGFVKTLLTLEHNPERCPLAPENQQVRYEVRQIFCGRSGGRIYRAVFVITENEVRVLRIRGAGQDVLRAKDLAGEKHG